MKFNRIIYILFLVMHCLSFADDSDTSATSTDVVTVIPDSLLSIPLNIHGKLSSFGVSTSFTINKQDLQTVLYRDMSDIFYDRLPVNSLSLGNFGQFNSFSYLGLMPNNIDYTYNGRSIIDKNFLSLNPAQIPHEDFENLEILEGSEAVLLSPNGSNLLINSQEIIHNTKSPYTRLWFSQAGFGHLASDGIYSLNFKPNWNFTFGYKGQTAQGQYNNDDFSHWNIRLRLRWNPSNKISISLTDNFTNHKLGISGGMNELTSLDAAGNIFLYSPIYSNQQLTAFTERNYRHDITLNVTSVLNNDSTSFISSGLYFSDILWRFEAPVSERIDTNSNEIQEYRIDQVGGFAKYSFKYLDFIKLNIGGDFSYHNVPESYAWEKYKSIEYSAYGLANLFLSNKLTLSGGLRQAYVYDNLNISFGTKIKYDFSTSSNAFFDFSYTEQSPSLSQGINLSKSDISSLLVAYSYATDNYFVSTKASYRLITSPLYSNALYRDETIFSSESFNGLDKNVLSASLSSGVSFIPDIMGDQDKLAFKASFLYNRDNSDYKTIPDYSIKIGTTYDFIIGRSKLFSGVNVTFIPPFTGMRFIPQQRVYAYLNNPSESAFKFNGVDVFVILKLGTAYVKLAMENLLGQDYYYVPYYPALQTNFNLSFSWTFLE